MGRHSLHSDQGNVASSVELDIDFAALEVRFPAGLDFFGRDSTDVFVKNAFALTKQLQEREIANGIKRRANGEAMKCALDEVSVREEALAKKEGREPDYYSQVITSEVSSYDPRSKE